MSVSQIKKRFEEFATYLGRVTHGLDKLKKLKDAVNELRTRLSSVEEKEASAVGRASEYVTRAHAAENELETAKVEIYRLRQITQNLERDLKLAVAVDEPAEADTENTSNEIKELELKRVMKHLRTRLRFCPLPTRHLTHNSFKATLRVWDRESLAKGWSHESLWTLGASIAVLVALDGVVVLESENLTRNMDVRDANADSSPMRQVVQWIQKTLKDDNSDPVGRMVRQEEAEKTMNMLRSQGR